MSTKLFKECDSWGDSSGLSGDVSFSFKKTPKKKSKAKAKKRKHSEIDVDPEAGKFVRAPKFYGLEDPDGTQETTSDSKKNKRKRKHDKVVKNLIESSDGITPEKKLKGDIAPDAEQSKHRTTFADKLRENLKGSRFRFINEQMYKQTGEDSMRIFKEDPTAFEAYHEGYRHQIAQWPMNPLDKIIKNIKRL